MRTFVQETILLLASASLFACGGDSGPQVLAGGGVGGGSIDGALNAFIIDEDTELPIANAEVYLGEGELLTAHTTDENGFIHIEQEDLKGPQTLTAAATGYVNATWFGVNGRDVTIPLTPTEATPVPQANLSGSIGGWSGLALPADDHFYVATIGYSQVRRIDDRANDIAQSLDPGMTNCFMFSNGLNQCSFTIASRTGQVAVYAAVLDVDSQGNLDPSDDTAAPIGFAIAQGIVVEDGVDQSGLELDLLPASSLGSLTVSVPAPPAGLTDGIVLVQADIGASGVISVATVALDDAASPIILPKLEGPFAGSDLRMIAYASSPGPAEEPAIATVVRDISSLSDTVTAATWPDLPTDLGLIAEEYSFQATSALFHGVELLDGNNGLLWSIGLFDGRSAFSLPAIPGDPINAENMVVRAVDGDFELDHFSFDEVLGDRLSFVASDRFSLP